MSEILLTTVNVSYLHRSLALRWLLVAAKGEHSVIIKEFTVKQRSEEIVAAILETKATTIGIGVYIYNVEIIKEIVRLLKAQRPKLRLLLGGPEISKNASFWFGFGVEALFIGEAERTFYQYLAEYPEPIEAKMIVNSPVVDLGFLESLESPYFVTELNDDYRHQYFYLESSRGCPFTCSYCQAGGQKLRYFSQSYLEKVFFQLQKMEVKQIKFLDRSFNVDSDHGKCVIKLCETLNASTIIQFEVVADRLSEDFMELLLSLNNPQRYRLEVGIQTFNQKSLLAVRRQQDNDLLIRRLRQLKEAGFTIHADLIAGLPYDDFASFKESVDTLYNLKLQEMQIGRLKLLAGSSLAKEYQSYGLIFAKRAPYQIETSPWMSATDLARIENAAKACDKLYNSGKLLNSLNYLITDLNQSAFTVLEKLGQLLTKLEKTTQLVDLFRAIAGLFDDRQLQAYLNKDYYRLFNQRTKRLFPDEISSEQQSKVLTYLVNTKQATKNEIDNYGTVCLGPRIKQEDYLVFIVRPQQAHPQLLTVREKDLP